MWCIDTRTHARTHAQEYYTAIKQDDCAIWDNTDDLEGIMLNEISQIRRTNTILFYSYVES